jgi:hypothetical protein
MKKTLSLTLFALILISCAPQAEVPQISIDLTSAEVFGTQFLAVSAYDVDTALNQLVDETPVAMNIEGIVTSVCQQEGCWMTLNATDGREMRVKFKDYDFFVPKDGAGRRVVMTGEGFIEETAVITLRHYAEDAGKSEEEVNEITEPAKEYIFVASGVAMFPAESM